MANIPWRQYRTSFHNAISRQAILEPRDRIASKVVKESSFKLFETLQGFIVGTFNERDFDMLTGQQMAVLRRFGSISKEQSRTLLTSYIDRISLEYRYLDKDVPKSIAELG